MRRLPLLAVSLLVAVGITTLAVGQAPKTSEADAIAAITKIENDGVKIGLTNDPAVMVPFNEKLLADDWTGGTSRGTWDTKASTLADLKDTKNNKTASSSLSDLKVRVSGDVAISTFKMTYDSLIKGEHFARTVICTDAFQHRGSEWKQIADHCSQAAK
jgi:ketosteroid isomerase-like protein